MKATYQKPTPMATEFDACYDTETLRAYAFDWEQNSEKLTCTQSLHSVHYTHLMLLAF